MNKLILFSIIYLVTNTLLQAQAEKFAEGVISNNGVFGLALTPDGKTAFFVNSNGGRDTMTIFTSTFKKGKWQKPQPAAFSNKPGIWKDIDPFVTPDGKMLIFNSNRPVRSNQTATDFDIWAVKKEGKNWGEPFHLGNEINSDSVEAYATMARNGNIYFGSNRTGNLGNFDIYVSEFKNGQYQTPVNLGSTINTDLHDSNPYISPDEDFLLFSSGTNGGDIVISYKVNGVWTSPQNLGPSVNTDLAEFCPMMIPGKNILYFARLQRSKPFVENIYRIPFNPKKIQQKNK